MQFSTSSRRPSTRQSQCSSTLCVAKVVRHARWPPISCASITGLFSRAWSFSTAADLTWRSEQLLSISCLPTKLACKNKRHRTSLRNGMNSPTQIQPSLARSFFCATLSSTLRWDHFLFPILIRPTRKDANKRSSGSTTAKTTRPNSGQTRAMKT
jgi:hypothetical protein